MPNKSYMTVVFEFNDNEKRISKSLEFAPLFFSDDSKSPFRVTTMSGQDEITKLNLVEFGHEVGDIDFIGEVLRAASLAEKVSLMKRCSTFSNENSCSLSSAYKELCHQ